MTDKDAVVALGGIFMILGIVGFALWQGFKTWQVSIADKVSIEREQAFETLADKSVYTQQKLLEQQERLMAEITDMQQRVVSIQQKLAEVD